MAFLLLLLFCLSLVFNNWSTSVPEILETIAESIGLSDTTPTGVGFLGSLLEAISFASLLAILDFIEAFAAAVLLTSVDMLGGIPLKILDKTGPIPLGKSKA